MTTNLIGSDVAFPIVITDTGDMALVQGNELIKQSLQIILTTQTGTRFFLGEFGANTEKILANPNDTVAQTVLNTMLREAIKTWETRVEVLKIEFATPTIDTLRATVHYKILKTNLVDVINLEWRR